MHDASQKSRQSQQEARDARSSLRDRPVPDDVWVGREPPLVRISQVASLAGDKTPIDADATLAAIVLSEPERISPCNCVGCVCSPNRMRAAAACTSVPSRSRFPSKRSSRPADTFFPSQILDARPLNNGKFDEGGTETPAPAKTTSRSCSRAILTSSGSVMSLNLIAVSR